MSVQLLQKVLHLLQELQGSPDVAGTPIADTLNVIYDLSSRALGNSLLTVRFFSDFAESYPEGMVLLDYGGNIVFWNGKMEELSGYTAEEINGMSIWSVHEKLAISNDRFKERNPEYVKLFTMLINGKLHHESPVTYKEKFKHKSGKIIYAQFSSFVLTQHEGKMICMTVRDVSDEQRQTTLLNRLFLVVEQSPSPILITNNLGLIEYVNTSFQRLFGYRSDEILGKNPRILKSDLTPDSLHENLWATLNRGDVWQGEVLDKRKDGSYIWLLTSIFPLRNSFGETENYISLYEDITQIKQMQTELRQALEFSEEANALKASILNNISHELRTPMNSILGYAQILNEELADPELKMYSEKITRSGNRLLNTLNSLINLSELEANKLVMSPDPINIGHIVRLAATSIEKVLREKGLALDVLVFEPDIYCTLDNRFVRKILSELMDNAIKFTERGSIRISVYKEQVEDLPENAVIEIADTGIGIDDDMMNLIFREFRQASEGFSRKFEGTGLGLTIARKFARLMGGELTVSSKLAVGSVFYLRFPVTNHEQLRELSVTEGLTNSDLRQKSVLLLTQSAADYHLLEYYLKGLFRVFPANTADEVIDAATRNRFDLVMVDTICLSSDGGETIIPGLRSIKEYQNTPFVALAGFTSQFDEESFAAEGFQFVLTKPIERSSVLKLISILA